KKWMPAAYTMAEGWHRVPRANPPVIESERRATSLEIIEECYPESEARRQGARCLRCNMHTVFDTSTCLACNGCVDVCPENLIRLVGLSRLIEEDARLHAAAADFGVTEAALQAMPDAELE